MSNTYNGSTFKGLYIKYENIFSKELWEWLNERDQIIRMQTASDLKRPAVQPLIKFLLVKFAGRINPVKKDERFKIKQMMGHMIRQVMEENGYEHDAYNVLVNDEYDYFSKASRYKEKKKSTVNPESEESEEESKVNSLIDELSEES
jgi:hypothetical protein